MGQFKSKRIFLFACLIVVEFFLLRTAAIDPKSEPEKEAPKTNNLTPQSTESKASLADKLNEPKENVQQKSEQTSEKAQPTAAQLTNETAASAPIGAPKEKDETEKLLEATKVDSEFPNEELPAKTEPESKSAAANESKAELAAKGENSEKSEKIQEKDANAELNATAAQPIAADSNQQGKAISIDETSSANAKAEPVKQNDAASPANADAPAGSAPNASSSQPADAPKNAEPSQQAPEAALENKSNLEEAKNAQPAPASAADGHQSSAAENSNSNSPNASTEASAKNESQSSPQESDSESEHQQTEPKRKLSALFVEALKLVDRVNKDPHRKWIAEPHKRFAELEKHQRSRLTGVRLIPHAPKKGNTGPVPAITRGIKLPKSFDARQKWPSCAQIIGTIRDQSSCGSCWAVSTGGMITDRLCIRRAELGKSPHQKLSPSFMVSELDILACSGKGDCEQGGYPDQAVQWVVENRVVSGGNFTANSFCMPYPFPNHGCKDGNCKTPECPKKCTNPGYTRPYDEDKGILGSGKGLKAGHLDGAGNVERIQTEIMTRGSVVAAMLVPSDLLYYKSGIYDPTTDEIVGAHAVRLIGWGEDADASGVNRPYWLVANSWNTDWGDKGFFRIIRGTDACQIESQEIDYLVIEANDV